MKEISALLLFLPAIVGIDVGERLKNGESWVSSGGTFAFGFHPTSDVFNLAIWYNIPKTVVWKAVTANNGSETLEVSKDETLVFSNEGLVVMDKRGQRIWRSVILECDQCVSSGSISEQGNFVLLGNDGAILWQSFDSPIDTLLPEQQFVGSMVLKSGKYSLRMSAIRVFLLFEDYPTQPYWDMTNKNLSSSDSLLQIPRLNLSSDGILTFYDGHGNSWNRSQTDTSLRYVLDYGSQAKRRITLESNGNLVIYSLSESEKSWSVVWLAKLQECDIFGICGPFGICSYRPTFTCSCPPGFHAVDPSDQLKGCEYDVSLQCEAKTNTLVQLDRADYPWNDYDFNASSIMSIEDCKRSCLKDCKCLAAAYKFTGSGLCFHKGDASELYNGVQSIFQNNIIFLKVSSPPPFPAAYHHSFFIEDVSATNIPSITLIRNHSNGIFVFTLIVAIVEFVLLFAAAVAALLLFLSRSNRTSKQHFSSI